MRTCCLLFLLAAGVSAVEPVITIQVGDPARTWTRLQDSVYAEALARPRAKPMALHLAQRLQPHLRTLGVADLDALSAAWGGSALALLPGGHGDPAWRAWIGGGDLASTLSAPLGVEDGRGTFDDAGAIVVFDDGIAIASDGSAGRLDPGTDAADIVVTFDPQALPGGDHPGSMPVVEGLSRLQAVVPERWALRVDPVGIDQELVWATAPAGLAPIDRSVLTRLPAESRALFAVGCDGAAMWPGLAALLGSSSLRDLMPDGGRAIDRARRWVDAELRALGLDDGLAELIAGFDGTILGILMAGDAVLPRGLLAVPRSATVDTVVTALLARSGTAIPAVGEQRFLQIPLDERQFTGVLVSGLVVGRDAGHWILASDALLAEDWLAGRTGGWLAKAAIDVGSDIELLTWSDTPAAIRILLPVAGLAAMRAGPRGSLAEAVLEYGLGLARAGRPDRLIGAATDDGGWRLHGRGPLGGAPMLSPSLGSSAVLAGLLLPAVSMARVAARRADSSNNMKQVLMGLIVYQHDHAMRSPPDLDALVQALEGELPERMLYSPQGHGVRDASTRYLYVPMAGNAKAMQPVLLDPVRTGDRLLVGYADGHTGTLTGEVADAIWQRANELRADPAVRERGAGPDDWGRDLLDRQ